MSFLQDLLTPVNERARDVRLALVDAVAEQRRVAGGTAGGTALQQLRGMALSSTKEAGAEGILAPSFTGRRPQVRLGGSASGAHSPPDTEDARPDYSQTAANIGVTPLYAAVMAGDHPAVEHMLGPGALLHAGSWARSIGAGF